MSQVWKRRYSWSLTFKPKAPCCSVRSSSSSFVIVPSWFPLTQTQSSLWHIAITTIITSLPLCSFPLQNGEQVHQVNYRLQRQACERESPVTIFLSFTWRFYSWWLASWLASYLASGICLDRHFSPGFSLRKSARGAGSPVFTLLSNEQQTLLKVKQWPK